MKIKGKFASDLEDGLETEELFISWLKNRIPVGQIKLPCIRERKYWDVLIKFSKSRKTFEIKSDFYLGSEEDSYSTLFIETGRGSLAYRVDELTKHVYEIPVYKEPTGLTTTKSDYWVHFVENFSEFWIIKVDDLKKVLMRELNRSRKEKRTFYKLGGNPISIGCLLPYENVKDDFRIFRIEERNSVESWTVMKDLYSMFNE